MNDLVAVGLTGTGLMSMLWTLAMGRSVVGIDSGGSFGGPVVWRLPEDLYGRLGLIDQMMWDRYGPGGVPRRADGSVWRLEDSLRQIATVVEPTVVVDDRPARTQEDFAPGPLSLHVRALDLLGELRGYLGAIEKMDSGPRVRLFTRHRLCADIGRIEGPDGVTSLGEAGLIVVDQDPEVVGFQSFPVLLDQGDGRGPVPARNHFVSCALDALELSSSRVRIASAFDEDHDEYWVRQVLRGNWLAVQVPEHLALDPVAEGMLSASARPGSAEYLDSCRHIVRGFFVAEAAQFLELPIDKVEQLVPPSGPRLHAVTARSGTDALVHENAVVAGDTFGTGHFIEGEDAIGHGSRVLRYWRDRDDGVGAEKAVRSLADGIAEDTAAWIRTSLRHFEEADQSHFNEDCFAELRKAQEHRRFLAEASAGGQDR